MARMFRISEDSNELIYDFDIIFFIANIWGLVHDLKFQQVLVCVWAVTFWEFDVTRVDHSALLAQKYGEDVHKKPAPFWKDPPRGDDFFFPIFGYEFLFLLHIKQLSITTVALNSVLTCNLQKKNSYQILKFYNF